MSVSCKFQACHLNLGSVVMSSHYRSKELLLPVKQAMFISWRSWKSQNLFLVVRMENFLQEVCVSKTYSSCQENEPAVENHLWHLIDSLLPNNLQKRKDVISFIQLSSWELKALLSGREASACQCWDLSSQVSDHQINSLTTELPLPESTSELYKHLKHLHSILYTSQKVSHWKFFLNL